MLCKMYCQLAMLRRKIDGIGNKSLYQSPQTSYAQTLTSKLHLHPPNDVLHINMLTCSYTVSERALCLNI
jgi:hypothetical protein